MPRTSSQAPVAQSGVIPFRVRRGQLEVVLVTARSGRGWTIPKGHLEPCLTAADSAAKEAFEEAGLIGRVSRKAFGRYSYEKQGHWRRVSVYVLRVRKMFPQWPEMAVRKRRWMSVCQAASRVRSAELRCCLQSFAARKQAPRSLAA
ncbi:MAG: NUDIX hydrolase [Phycisphaerales bacterium]|nr:NUDIX hydrolase [Phycisphaerales bacterium]